MSDQLGAIVGPGGVTFRVWAPHAEAVSVVGSFNGWDPDTDPMSAAGDGCWFAEVPGAAPGDEYRYAVTYQGQTALRSDPRALQVISSIGNSVVVDRSALAGEPGFRMPGWHELVIYEMHVGTFNDFPGGAPGTFTTAIERLGHLTDLGVNAIELMPSTEFAMDFSWGYNPSQPFAIEEAYGGHTAFRAFVDAAHDHGLAVILDVVYNHWGPSDNTMWRYDGWSEWGGGGIYFYNDWRRLTRWGDRPDYGRPEVRQFILDNALFWLEDFGLDGLRWDATAYIRDVHGDDGGSMIADGWRLMRDVNTTINTRQPWKISIAEDLRDNHAITDPDGAAFDTQWDGGFVHPVRNALTVVRDEWRSMPAVRDAILHGYGDHLRRIVYTESHDEVANGKARLPTEIAPTDPEGWFAKKRSTLGATLVFTSPGIPMIFQGQELLEDRWFHDQDPLEWDRLDRLPGIVDLYRDLIHLRRNWHDTTAGLRGAGVAVHHVNDSDKLIAFHRWDRGGPGDDVMVVANFANRSYPAYTIGFPRPGRWRVRLNSDWDGYDPGFGAQHAYDTEAYEGPADGMGFHGDVGIGPYTALILSQDR